jgi:hypothetical protein
MEDGISKNRINTRLVTLARGFEPQHHIGVSVSASVKKPDVTFTLALSVHFSTLGSSEKVSLNLKHGALVVTSSSPVFRRPLSKF